MEKHTLGQSNGLDPDLFRHQSRESSCIFDRRRLYSLTDRTSKTTTITFIFPDEQTADYQSDNVILEDFIKEKIIEKG